MSISPSILLVDDDAETRDLLSLGLRAEGFRTVQADGSQGALDMYRAHHPDLVVLDVGLGAMSGIETCRRLRSIAPVPVVFLTSQADELDQLIGFAAGCDAYLTKPVSNKLLSAHISAVLGREGSHVNTVQTNGPITIDMMERSASIDSTPLDLTRLEFELLAVLVESPRRVLTRSELVERVWGAEYASDRSIEALVSRLRHKIRDAGGNSAIEAVRGVGYRLSNHPSYSASPPVLNAASNRA